MSDKWILDGQTPKVAELMEWARWFQSAGPARIVAKTALEESHVSTVFLGIDHGDGAGGPPLLFETMVFGGTLDGEQERHATWDEAERGHAAMVERVRPFPSGGNRL